MLMALGVVDVAVCVHQCFHYASPWATDYARHQELVFFRTPRVGFKSPIGNSQEYPQVTEILLTVVAKTMDVMGYQLTIWFHE